MSPDRTSQNQPVTYVDWFGSTQISLAMHTYIDSLTEDHHTNIYDY